MHEFYISALLALIIRIVLLIYGIWQDGNSTLKYTDIDYWIFNDASNIIWTNGNPFIGNTTYRYSPLLALLLIPNKWTKNLWGKSMFILADIGCAYFLYRLMTRRNIKLINYLWLFNPFIMTISTRGNAESILSLIILASLSFIQRGKLIWSAMLYGLSVHFKLYPIIYIIPILASFFPPSPNYNLLIERKKGNNESNSAVIIHSPKKLTEGKGIASILSPSNMTEEEGEAVEGGRKGIEKAKNDHFPHPIMKCVIFGLVSFLFFALFTFASYFMFGIDYIQEGFLYHLIRKDHRHNFSPYFLLFYLEKNVEKEGINSFLLSSLLAFVPQLILLLIVGIKYGRRDYIFGCFIQTMIFVHLNKVCTSQVFVHFPLSSPFHLIIC